MTKDRVVFLDWLRVIACFLVIVTHCNEPFYLGGQGTMVASSADAFWSTPATVLCSAVSTYAVSAVVSVLIRKIPKAGKYIAG